MKGEENCIMRSSIICTIDEILLVRMGEMRNIYKILVVKTEGKRSLGRFSRRGEYNIRMDLRDRV
jgi:hypothetical protein